MYPLHTPEDFVIDARRKAKKSFNKGIRKGGMLGIQTLRPMRIIVFARRIFRRLYLLEQILQRKSTERGLGDG